MGVVVRRKCPMTVFLIFPLSMGLIWVYDSDITVQMVNHWWYSMSWNVDLNIRVCNSGYHGLACLLDMIYDQSEGITPLVQLLICLFYFIA